MDSYKLHDNLSLTNALSCDRFSIVIFDFKRQFQQEK